MPAAATPAIDLSPEAKKSKYNASDLWRGLPMLQQQQSSLPVRQRYTRRGTLLQLSVRRCSLVCAYFTMFSPAFRPGRTRARTSNKCCLLRRGDGKECPLFTHNDTKALITHLHKDHEAEWNSVLAASSRSVQTKSQRAAALVEASGINCTPWTAARAGP